jgi:branched-chain amino acid transport system ATP-binding protein
VLSVESLDLAYDGMQVLFGVSFEMSKGRSLAVLGANGAGKTSLLRAIAGITPSTGTIVFDGEAVSRTSVPDRVRNGIVLVPEGRELFPSLTVRDNLAMGASVLPRRDVARVFDDVVDRIPLLAGWLDMPANGLSGGQQQILAVARALMARPRLLLLDEPSLGLAPNNVALIYQLLGRITEAGTAVVVAEQNVSAALGLAERAVVLANGRVQLDADAAVVRDDPTIAVALLGVTIAKPVAN